MRDVLRKRAHAIASLAIFAASTLVFLKLLDLSPPNLWCWGFLSGYVAYMAAEIAHTIAGND